MLPETAFDDTVRDQANQLTEQDRYGEAADLVRTAVRVKAGLSARSGPKIGQETGYQTLFGAVDDVTDGYDLIEEEDGLLDGYLEEAKGLYDDLEEDGATALEDLYTHTPEDDGKDLESLFEDGYDDDITVMGHFHEPFGARTGPHYRDGVDEPVQVLGVSDEQRFEAWSTLFDSMTDA